jgi:hypothetical protein
VIRADLALGHADEARRVLLQADQWIANAEQSKRGTDGDKQSGWTDEHEKPTVLLLRREAESVVFRDTELPFDPFAL